MTATKNYTVNSTDWTLVSDGLENVLIGHESVFPMHVFRGTAAPTGSDGYRTCSADEPWSMSGISGQKVYVRCGKSGEAMVVTVDAV